MGLSLNLLGSHVCLYCGLSLGRRHMPHLDIAVAIVVLAPATKGMAEVLTHVSPAASRQRKNLKSLHSSV